MDGLGCADIEHYRVDRLFGDQQAWVKTNDFHLDRVGIVQGLVGVCFIDGCNPNQDCQSYRKQNGRKKPEETAQQFHLRDLLGAAELTIGLFSPVVLASSRGSMVMKARKLFNRRSPSRRRIKRPPWAMEIVPDSSDTTTATASLTSEIPKAAR